MHFEDKSSTKSCTNMNQSRKPKVPLKPSYLAYRQKKNSSSTIHSSNIECQIVPKQKKKNCKIPDNRKKPLISQENRCRRSSSPVVISKEFQRVMLPLSITPSFECIINSQRCINDDNVYVEINHPNVEPGTLIRTDEVSGEINIVTNGMAQTESQSHQRRFQTRSASDTAVQKQMRDVILKQRGAMVEELRKCFESASLEELRPPILSNSSVDECGYEIPIALQTPVYMSLDDVSIVREETDTASDASQKNPVFKLARNKKVRVARYRRNLNGCSNTDEGSGAHSSIEGEVECSSLDYNAPIDEEQSPQNPISSFLSVRPQSNISSTQEKHKETNLDYHTSMSSSSFSYSASDTDDEWSDNDSEYYQQIDFTHSPKNLARRNEHAYEMIVECRDTTSNKTHRRHPYENVDLQLNPKPKICSAHLTQRAETHIQRQHRKNFSEIRYRHASDCTWATVSTPGVLKLADFKNLGRTVSKEQTTAQA